MPPRREPGAVARCILGAFVIGVAVAAAALGRPFVVGLSALVALWALAFWLSRKHWQRLATARTGESICTFARSFPRRSVDPWILRAMYEELQQGLACPIRADDHFERDLWCDLESVEDLAVCVARRARRSLDPVAGNAPVGIETVRDLVLFLERQPRLATPA